MTKEQELPFP